MARKLALLIGNDEYNDARLNNLNAPLEDVKALEDVLRRPDIGQFDEVVALSNPPIGKVLRAISVLFADKRRDDLLLFYFSGHGIKDHSGELFLSVKETEQTLLDGTAIPASLIKNIVNKSRSRRQVLILDCCHSGAFTGGFKASGQVAISEDTFTVRGYGREILTASNAIQYAVDGEHSVDKKPRSVFTRFLVEGLETGSAAGEGNDTVTVEQLYDYVHTRVVEAQSNMTPSYWCDQREGQRLTFARNPHPVIWLPDDLLSDLEDSKVRTRLGAVHELQTLIETGTNVQKKAALRVLQERQPNERDRFVYQAIENCIDAGVISTDPVLSVSAVEDTKLVGETKYQPGSVFQDSLKDGSNGLEMVVIPEGKFQMGDIQGSGDTDEKPVHEVKICKAFALSKYPVTFDEYDLFPKAKGIEKSKDLGWGLGKRPVINISWEDAMAYAQWLSEQTSKGYRLPSESEWEYAARAGTSTNYWWGDDIGSNQANCIDGGSEWGGEKTSPVDTFKVNPFGLHDMLGNVYEWVQDCWHDNYKGAPKDGSAWVEKDCVRRVIRGGSWYSHPRSVRSANRSGFDPGFSLYNVGFRLAQDL